MCVSSDTRSFEGAPEVGRFLHTASIQKFDLGVPARETPRRTRAFQSGKLRKMILFRMGRPVREISQFGLRKLRHDPKPGRRDVPS